jgi:hypothetical protein
MSRRADWSFRHSLAEMFSIRSSRHRTRRLQKSLPAAELGDFVQSLAHRIASFPAFGLSVIKERVNAVALAPADDFRRDSSLFLDCVRKPEAQNRIKTAMKRGFQTRGAEMALPRMLDDLTG